MTLAVSVFSIDTAITSAGIAFFMQAFCLEQQWSSDVIKLNIDGNVKTRVNAVFRHLHEVHKIIVYRLVMFVYPSRGIFNFLNSWTNFNYVGY